MRTKAFFAGSVVAAILAVLAVASPFGAPEAQAMVYYYCWECSGAADDMSGCSETQYETEDHESVPLCPEGTFLSQSQCAASCGAPSSSSSSSSSSEESSSSSSEASAPSSSADSSSSSSSSSSDSYYVIGLGTIDGAADLLTNPVFLAVAAGFAVFLALIGIAVVLRKKGP